jgi:hypothetical protein
MRRATVLSSCISTLILLFSGAVLAQSEELQTITQQQANTLLSVLQHKTANVADLSQFPPLPYGALDPMPAVTGVPCLVPNNDESRHWVQYLVGTGTNARRTVFDFTVSPSIPSHNGEVNLVSLFNKRRVTQYWVWHASVPPQEESPQDAGVVVDFHTRAPSFRCIPL